MRAKWRSLIAVVLLGVGLVLFGLGFDSHTTEALPFGLAGLVAGVAIGWPSVRALRAAVRALEPAAPGVTSASAPSGGAAPSTFPCSNCGAVARLRLDRPTHAECEHCHARLTLPPAVAQQLAAAAAAVQAQARAEREVDAVISSLPEREAQLGTRLAQVSVGLAAAAVLAGLFGFLRRFHDDAWHGYLLFAIAAAPTALVLGAWARRTVPKAVWGIISGWAALRLPGHEGLACRACGAPLPAETKPVLRCDYCGADSLASPAVLERVSQQASHATRAVLGVGRQSRAADELAAFSLRAFPTLVLVGWFGIGAAAGGVLLRAFSETEFPVPGELRYALVDGCVAGVSNAGDAVFLDAETRQEVSKPMELFPASALVGRKLVTGATLTKVWSRLSAPGRPCATTSDGRTLYLPGPYGGGERICLSR